MHHWFLTGNVAFTGASTGQDQRSVFKKKKNNKRKKTIQYNQNKIELIYNHNH